MCGGVPITLKFSHPLVIRSFKGTSRNVATGGWGKLHTVATQGLRGWKTPWHRAMRLSLPPPSGRGRQRKGEGTPVIQPALVEAQRGASNREDQGCAVSNAHTSQIFGARVAASSLCTRASVASKAGKSMLLHTAAGLFPLPIPTVSCTRAQSICGRSKPQWIRKESLEKISCRQTWDLQFSWSETQPEPYPSFASCLSIQMRKS